MTITHVQSGGVTSDGVNSTSRAFASNVAVGNIVAAQCSKDNGGSAFAAGDCTKTAGTATIDTPHLAVSIDFDLGGGIGNRRVAIWHAKVTGAGSLTLGVNSGATTYWVYATSEWASDVGWDSTSANRVEDTDTGSSATDSATTAATGAMTSAGAGLFLGSIVSESTASDNVVFTPDGAFTSIYEEEAGSSHLVGSHIRRIVASGTTDAAEWAITAPPANAGYACVGVVLKETGGGGGPTGPPPGTLLQMGVGV